MVLLVIFVLQVVDLPGAADDQLGRSTNKVFKTGQRKRP